MISRRCTVIGGRGFIGAAVVERLRADGHRVAVAAHRDDFTGAQLGEVIYSSGIAASVAEDAGYAFESHVNAVARILEGAEFDSFLYLSSTRVYGSSPVTAENTPLTVDPGASDIFRISKIAGEARCLAHPSGAVRVARLSNIYGGDYGANTFLGDVLRQSATRGRADVRTQRGSAKDYLSVADAARYLGEIAFGGTHRLYNVAYGRNIENGTIYDALARCGVMIDIAPDSLLARTPAIDARRTAEEFGPPADDLIAMIPELLTEFKRHPEVTV